MAELKALSGRGMPDRVREADHPQSLLARFGPGQPLKLVPGQEFVAGHVIFRIGGAAIDAAEIAAIGDRDAQVGDGAVEFVGERHW